MYRLTGTRTDRRSFVLVHLMKVKRSDLTKKWLLQRVSFDLN
jgi:hypothetical protein